MQPFRLIVVILFYLNALPVMAQSGPETIVKDIYDTYSGPGQIGLWPSDPGPRAMFSARLRPLLEKDYERAETDGIGLLDFDIFVDGQDFDLSDVEIGRAAVSGDRATVEARFRNFGEPKRIVYGFVREDGAWKIDEVWSPDGEYPWALSELLSR